MKVTISYDACEQPWAHEWKKALRDGVARCGDDVSLVSSREIGASHGDVTVTWGLRGGRKGLMARTIARGGRHLVMERGFIGNREKWTALGFDGIAGRATFATVDDPSRLATLFPGVLKEWRDARDVAMVMGQVEGDATTKHVDVAKWYQKAVSDLLAIGWNKVLFRPHPIEHRKKRFKLPRGASLSTPGTIQEAIADVGLVVTFNSTSGVDAVLHGVCVYAADKGSPAYEVAGRDYAVLRRDPREGWAERLAWHQWSLEEVRSGAAWSALREVARRT